MRVLWLLVILSALLVEKRRSLVIKTHEAGQLLYRGEGRVGTDQNLLLDVVLKEVEVGADEVIVLNTCWQLHGEAIKRDNPHFVDDKHYFWPRDFLVLQGRVPRMGGPAGLLNLVVVFLYANQHIDRVVDIHTGRVTALEVLLAHSTEETANRVEAIRSEELVRGLRLGRKQRLESGEVGVESPANICCGLNGALTRQSVFINVRPKGLLVLGR